MDSRVSQLERQNRLLKVIILLIVGVAVASFSMGSATFNQDRGELVNITKIQLVDEKGKEVAVIDAAGINYTGKNSRIVADKIIGRRSVAANSNPENSQRYAELGVTSDRTCYTELGNKGAVYHRVLSENGVLESNY